MSIDMKCRLVFIEVEVEVFQVPYLKYEINSSEYQDTSLSESSHTCHLFNCLLSNSLLPY